MTEAVIELSKESFSRREDRELPAVVPGNVTPMQLLNMAVAQGADLAKLEKLMDLQERWEKNEARKAYDVAMAEFKANPPVVYKDKQNAQYGSMYTTIGNLVNTINAELSKHGLSARWNIDQTNGIKVSCVLTHRAGHSETVSMTGPTDTSGAKNPLQQIKSTVTYLKIATFEAITGTASTDGNADDDGTGAGKNAVDPQKVADWELGIAECADLDRLKALALDITKVCEAAKDLDTYRAMKEKVAARRTALKAAK